MQNTHATTLLSSNVTLFVVSPAKSFFFFDFFVFVLLRPLRKIAETLINNKEEREF